MKKFYLAQFLNVFLTKDNLFCVGIPNSNKYIEFAKNSENLKILEKLIYDGIEETHISSNQITKELYKKDMLVFIQKMDRKELFFDYLKINYDKFIIQNFKILIFGAGAGGSSLAYLLAQFGFKKIKIIDSDIVEETDIIKTSVFKKEHIGLHKVKVLNNEVFRNFDSKLEICINKPFTKNEIKQEVESYIPDLIVKACDPDLMFRRNLNEICMEIGIPYFSLSYSYENVLIGPFIVPNITSCDKYLEEVIKNTCGEHFGFDKINKLSYENLYHPSISFNVNLMASLALKEIVFFSLGKKELIVSLGSLIMFNILTFRSSQIKLNCQSSCQYCKNNDYSFN